MLGLIFLVVRSEVILDQLSFDKFFVLKSLLSCLFSSVLAKLVLLRFFPGNTSSQFISGLDVFSCQDFFKGGFQINSLLKTISRNSSDILRYLLISGGLSSFLERKLSFSFFENLGEDKCAVELFHSVGFVEGESPGVLDCFAPLFGLVDTFLDIFLVADLGFALFSELLRFQLRLVLAGDCVAPSADLKFGNQGGVRLEN